MPAISFAFEKPEDDLMKRKPRHPYDDRLVNCRLACFLRPTVGNS